jgi:hypothetical protein
MRRFSAGNGSALATLEGRAFAGWMKARLMWLLSLAFIAALHVVANADDQKGKKADPIVGTWLWHGSNLVTIHSDGRAESKLGEAGRWRFLEKKELERKYEFTWGQGVMIQQMRLSKNGQKLEGKEKDGSRVWAERAAQPQKLP